LEARIRAKTVEPGIGNIAESKSTGSNHIASLAAKNGAGTKGEVGEGSEGITASGTDSKTYGLGSCEAHHVCGRSPQDCSVSAGKMGKDQATKEGCIAALKAASLSRNRDAVPNVTFPARIIHGRL